MLNQLVMTDIELSGAVLGGRQGEDLIRLRRIHRAGRMSFMIGSVSAAQPIGERPRELWRIARPDQGKRQTKPQGSEPQCEREEIQ
jgi:hypothetical protein